MMNAYLSHIPQTVYKAFINLENAGFKAFLVGGCVRDLLLQRIPKDWDITTNAKPEEISSLFPKTFYENPYGTVGVVTDNVSDETLKVIEITPFRKESKYSDNRHPDKVIFCNSIEEDLARRDFTINAMALSSKGQIIDPYKGQNDLTSKEIRTVGDPDTRFQEDALRLLRAVRISVELGFTINMDTEKSIFSNNYLLKKISRERVRDEFIKIVSCKNPDFGMQVLRKLNLMSFIIPELEETYDVRQNKAHSFDVWNHLIKSLKCTADKGWPLHVRLAALFHDIGKPRSRRWAGDKKEWTFYGHDVVGARMTKKILQNLKFPKKEIELITKLVRWHMFFSDTEQITLSAVRRIVANVGKENIWDLMNLRIADRIGTGRPKESPYRLRKYRSMIDEALHDPISVSMLKIDGKDIIEITNSNPGPKVGHILHILLEDVLDDPSKNNMDYLKKRTLELYKMDEKILEDLGKKAKEKKNEEEENNLKEIRKKHFVK
jgi:tRNA nucleotidyltransferase (CCA-adding enzyme)